VQLRPSSAGLQAATAPLLLLSRAVLLRIRGWQLGAVSGLPRLPVFAHARGAALQSPELQAAALSGPRARPKVPVQEAPRPLLPQSLARGEGSSDQGSEEPTEDPARAREHARLYRHHRLRRPAEQQVK